MIAAICAVIMLLFLFPNPSIAGRFKVTHVYDGDTIMAEGCDIVIYVLLAGIDAPEIALQEHEEEQRFGRKAKHYLEQAILDEWIEIKAYGLGPYPYNHLIGEIFLQNKNINIQMIREGLAEVWREQLPQGLVIAPYIDAEEEAKKARRGIWSLGDAYVSPREWRRIHAQP
ncbi:MAG: thermonuclease family protein [Thermodesulfobacteriota bacterium]